MFKMDDVERVDEGMEPQQINVSSSFSSFKEFKERLDHLKKQGYHPFRVFNSQTGKDYNRKRATKK